MKRNFDGLKFKRANKKLLYTFEPPLKGRKNISRVSTTNKYSERGNLEKKYKDKFKRTPQLKNLVSYVGNKKAPFLSIYRYKEAFSYKLVDLILRNLPNERVTVLDPFCGMGTTLFTAALNNTQAYGVDKLPLAVFISNTLNDAVSVDKEKVRNKYFEIKERVKEFKEAEIAEDVKILKKVIPKKKLSNLKRWKSAINAIENRRVRNVIKLFFLSMLIDTSYAKNSGQFLRVSKNKKVKKPTVLMEKKLKKFEKSKEIRLPGNEDFFENNRAYLGDSRDLPKKEPIPNTVITSPPYPNRYDYTRSYSLELAFSFVKSNKELIELRHDLLRSHIESKIDSNILKNIHPAAKEVVEVLNEKELNNNKITDMIIGYFYDMRKSIESIANTLEDESRIFMVVDNVRYEGEVVPTDLILTDMAESYGFKLNKLLIPRYKGNSAQQMKEYGRVPVRESILWLEREK